MVTLDDQYVPPKDYMEDIIRFFYRNFPEANSFADKIHIVYASTQREYSFLDRSSDSIIDEISMAFSQKKTKIVFFGSSETLLDNFTLKAQEIADSFQSMPVNTFFYSCAGLNAVQCFEKLIEGKIIKNKLTILVSNSFALVSKNYSIKHNYEYKISVKPKKFLCFNKVQRGHRIILLANVIRRGLFDKSFYSFQGHNPHWFSQVNWGRFDTKIKKTIWSIKDKFPITLNITEERSNPVDITEDDYYYHEQSYFSLVTETTYFQKANNLSMLSYVDPNFFSEKIFRAIHLKHPFVLVAFPGALEKLKELGYKTFEPFIDEKYDTVYDDDRRIDVILDEVERLCNLTDEQWIEWQNSVKSIVDYNYDLFFNTEDYSVNCDVKKLFK